MDKHTNTPVLRAKKFQGVADFSLFILMFLLFLLFLLLLVLLHLLLPLLLHGILICPKTRMMMG